MVSYSVYASVASVHSSRIGSTKSRRIPFTNIRIAGPSADRRRVTHPERGFHAGARTSSTTGSHPALRWPALMTIAVVLSEQLVRRTDGDRGHQCRRPLPPCHRVVRARMARCRLVLEFEISSRRRPLQLQMISYEPPRPGGDSNFLLVGQLRLTNIVCVIRSRTAG
jgi:hypothetical protein